MSKLFLDFHKVIKKITANYYNISYSQCGEDIIVKFIFDSLGIKGVSYLDIGANDPVRMNNTFLFYQNGSRGICIEPDPVLYAEIIKKRSGDKCLNIGVSGDLDDTTAPFYIMSDPVMNTFVKEEAMELEQRGSHKIQEVRQTPLLNINNILEKYNQVHIDYLSLDVEGLDFLIIQSMDFTKYRPKVICTETITYSTNLKGEKRNDMISLLLSKGYKVFSDTYVNTIFIDESI